MEATVVLVLVLTFLVGGMMLALVMGYRGIEESRAAAETARAAQAPGVPDGIEEQGGVDREPVEVDDPDGDSLLPERFGNGHGDVRHAARRDDECVGRAAQDGTQLVRSARVNSDTTTSRVAGLIADRRIRFVSFTGSVAGGAAVQRAAGEQFVATNLVNLNPDVLDGMFVELGDLYGWDAFERLFGRRPQGKQSENRKQQGNEKGILYHRTIAPLIFRCHTRSWFHLFNA